MSCGVVGAATGLLQGPQGVASAVGRCMADGRAWGVRRGRQRRLLASLETAHRAAAENGRRGMRVRAASSDGAWRLAGGGKRCPCRQTGQGGKGL